MLMASRLSQLMGNISEQDMLRIKQILTGWSLPTTPPADMGTDDFMGLMDRDKKVLDGQMRLVLLSKLGKAMISGDFESGLLRQVLSEYCRE